MDVKNRILRKLMFLSLSLLLLVACEKVSFPPIEVTNVKYKVDIQPILDKNCVKCHPTTRGLDFNPDFSYNELVPKYASVADSAKPEESKLYKQLTGTSHKGHTTDEEKMQFLKWIDLGVPNN